MKKLLIVLAVAMSSPMINAQSTTTKQVCVNIKKDGKTVVDSKTGKTKQNCRPVKQHKKLDGTKVPEKK